MGAVELLVAAKPAGAKFIGPFGAIFASVFYLLIGAASYFLAAALLGFGAAKLFYPRLRVMRVCPGLSSSSFPAPASCNCKRATSLIGKKTSGSGRVDRYFFGKKLLLTAMGDVGSMILLAGIYLSALIS